MNNGTLMTIMYINYLFSLFHLLGQHGQGFVLQEGSGSGSMPLSLFHLFSPHKPEEVCHANHEDVRGF